MGKRGSRLVGGAELLEITDLHVAVEGREILHGVNLVVSPGEVVVLEGENGSGKSTVARAVMGLMPVLAGEVKLEGESLLPLSIDERARRGVFLAWQAPPEIHGIQFAELLHACRGRVDVARLHGDVALALGSDLRTPATNVAKAPLTPSMYLREVYVGWSGGEKKRGEVAQMVGSGAKLAILDEVDSGLDRKAAREISKTVAEWQKETGAGLLVISHNRWILEYLKVDRTYEMEDGRCLVKKS